MERTEVLDMMGELKLYGMKSAYDETLAVALKRQHELQRFVGDLLRAEISEKQARSIKYQLTIAKLPLAKDIDDFVFKGTPINEALVRALADGAFLAEQRNAVLIGGTGTSRSPAVASAPAPVVGSSRPSISSIGSKPRRVAAARAASPIISPAWTSSSSTNSAISPSPSPAASCSFTLSVGFTSARRSL
jgi:IstB-like ATP binding protein